MIAYVLAVALFANIVLTEAKFSWTNCASDSPLAINSLEIGPDPIVVPGELQISLSGSSSVVIGNSSLSLSIKRDTWLGEIGIPCISNIGSCKYPNMCTLVDQMINEDWLGIAASVGRQIRDMLKTTGIDTSHACPQPPRSLTIDHASIHLPEIPAALSIFAAGDYHIRIEGVDDASQQMLLCVDARVTVHEACTGFSCIFGRK
ncbi:ganglioside GM2 activator-like [Mya arenaria]|uniref:ganglioside GM2 activator-like n=1 Tax=Mya arenaria TaxID=6604 RepID=UPI0022E35A67|nr:ganglioside GM2 activator-like [Mya arenaria]